MATDEEQICADFVCSICNQKYSKYINYEEHMKSKGHLQKCMQMELKSLNQNNALHNKSMMGTSASDVDRAVTSLLLRLNEMQHASMVKHKDDRVSGLC